MDELWLHHLESQGTRGAPHRFQWVFKPLHTGMRMFGLIFSHRPDNPAGISFSSAYFALVFALLWMNFLRFFAAYTYREVLGPTILRKVFVHFIYGLGAMSVTAYARLSNRGHLVNKEFESYHDKYHRWDGKQQKQRRQRVWIVLFVCLICILLEVTLIFLKIHLLLPVNITIDMHFGGLLSNHIPWFLEFMLVVSVLYNSAAVLFIVAYILMVSTILAEEFRAHAKDMQTMVENLLDFSKNLEYLRLRYRDLCKVTMRTDEVFSMYILVIYVGNILICCFVIYISLHVRMESDFLLQMASTFIPLFLVFLAQLFILTYGGTLLNNAVGIP